MARFVPLGYQLRKAIHLLVPHDRQRAERYFISGVNPPLSIDPSVWEMSAAFGPEDFFLSEMPQTIVKDAVLILASVPEIYMQKIAETTGSQGIQSSSPPSGEWLDAGFDIADMRLISGLANCSPAPSREELGLTNTDFNAYGLIPSADKAQSLCQKFDSRFPQHSPFMPYFIKIQVS